MKIYPIYEGKQIIGEAQVSCEGLYYVIRCSGPTTNGPRRICVKCADRSVMLGLCVPNGKEMTLLRRMPKYKLDGTDMTFCVYSENDGCIRVLPDRPLKDLSELRRVKLELRDGKHYFRFADQSSSRPTGQ